MKNFLVLLTCSILFPYCSKPDNTPLKKEALETILTGTHQQEITLQEVIKKHSGSPVLIDIWASWCGDCIKGYPKVKSIQKKYPQTKYVFISLDENQQAWKRGVSRYQVHGENYHAPGGWKGEFSKHLDVNWIPRYILINPNGEVVLYEAKNANDSKLNKLLKNLN